MVSPEGWLFDKEALLKYIIEKKQEYARKLKEYERQKDRDLKVRQIGTPKESGPLKFGSTLSFPKLMKSINYFKSRTYMNLLLQKSNQR